MRWKRKLGLRLRSIFKRSQVEQDLDDELRDYYERETAASPIPPGLERLKEECRDARGTGGLEDGLKDLQLAFRSMQHAPGFTLTVVATLALGIGANTAIFSVIDGVLIQPLGYAAEDRLVTVHEAEPQIKSMPSRLPVNALHFLEWRRSVHAFEQMAIIGDITLNLTPGNRNGWLPHAFPPACFPCAAVKWASGWPWALAEQTF